MATAFEVQQRREMMALQTADLDAVTEELTTLRAASTQAEVQSCISLVDTKLLTKPNVYSGEHDGKERWSFKIRSWRSDKIRETQHTARTCYILNLWKDGEALYIAQNNPMSTRKKLRARRRSLCGRLVVPNRQSKWQATETGSYL